MKEKKSKRFEIEVSRTGTFTPMEGKPVTITRDMLVSMANNYDPVISESPFVAGHPELDAPAFGQVEEFKVTDDDRLVACGETGTIDPWFKSMVKRKAYNKVSLAFFPPNATSNPKPGTWYPKHVGCLGAVPPAVPNLKPGLTQLAFSEDEYSEVIECSYAINHVNPGLWRGLREWFIEQFGTDKADEVLPSWKVATLEESGVEADVKASIEDDASTNGQGSNASAFSDSNEDIINMSEQEIADLKAKNAKLEAEVKAKQTALDTATIAQRAQRNAGITSFCEGLVADEQCLPATAAKLGAILKALPVDQSLSFSEGGAAEDLGESVMDVVKAIASESFDFAEKTKDDEGLDTVQSFAAPKGVAVDPKRAALAVKARKLADEQSISFADACTQLGA